MDHNVNIFGDNGLSRGHNPPLRTTALGVKTSCKLPGSASKPMVTTLEG